MLCSKNGTYLFFSGKTWLKVSKIAIPRQDHQSICLQASFIIFSKIHSRHLSHRLKCFYYISQMDDVGPSCSATQSPAVNILNGESNEENVPMEVDDDESNVARIVIEGLDDEGGEMITKTAEEAKSFILSMVQEYMKDPKINPLLVEQEEITALHSLIKSKNDEFNRISKLFEVLYRDQVKFLRFIGVMPKAETKIVGVSVDLPWIAESVPGLLQSDSIKQETLLSSNKLNVTPKSSACAKPVKKDPSGPIECIDLTDEDPSSVKSEKKFLNTASAAASATDVKPPLHPAPLPPPPPFIGDPSEIPAKPLLKISVDKKGIVLQWDLPPPAKKLKLKGFEIFGYQEKSNVPVSSALWKKIGDVDPLTLPMSCTLTQFVEGFKYHFTIRAITLSLKYGAFCDPASIMFIPDKKS